MAGRGRGASKPSRIPARGWKDIALRVKDGIGEDRVGFIAAGITFYLLMALIPLLAAVVGAYGLIADPADVAGHLQALEGIIPAEMMELVREELERVASKQDAAGVGLIIGLLLALWGGTKATDALMVAMNVAYNEKESRNFFMRKMQSYGLTFGSIVFLCVALTMLGGVPAVVAAMHLPSALETALSLTRWPILFIVAMLWLSVVYRYAPCREEAKWRWVSWGAFAATLLWVLGSAAFSFYAANFGNYNNTYGSLGAIVVLMMWFYISGFCGMLGAELNAEIEHQTVLDTTTGSPQPLGERDAHVADTIGKAR